MRVLNSFESDYHSFNTSNQQPILHIAGNTHSRPPRRKYRNDKTGD